MKNVCTTIDCSNHFGKSWIEFVKQDIWYFSWYKIIIFYFKLQFCSAKFSSQTRLSVCGSTFTVKFSNLYIYWIHRKTVNKYTSRSLRSLNYCPHLLVFCLTNQYPYIASISIKILISRLLIIFIPKLLTIVWSIGWL